MTWVAAWGAVWLAHVLAALGGWVLILAASYLVAILLAAVIVCPCCLTNFHDPIILNLLVWAATVFRRRSGTVCRRLFFLSLAGW